MYLSLNIKNTRLLHLSVSSRNAVSQYSIERSIVVGECCPLFPQCVHHSWATLSEQRLFLKQTKRWFLRPRSGSAQSHLSEPPSSAGSLSLKGRLQKGNAAPGMLISISWSCSWFSSPEGFSQALPSYSPGSRLSWCHLDLCPRSSGLSPPPELLDLPAQPRETLGIVSAGGSDGPEGNPSPKWGHSPWPSLC